MGRPVIKVPCGGGPPYLLYKKVGDEVFLTEVNAPLLVAQRIPLGLIWRCSGRETGERPEGNELMIISNWTISDHIYLSRYFIDG